MTERQVGRQIQTVELVLRVRSTTGLQKAFNSPFMLCTIFILHSVVGFQSALLRLLCSRDGHFRFHSLRSETTERQQSETPLQTHRQATQLP
jgi:hypothetical protein